MHHHDSRDYDVAAGEAAAGGRKQMEALIERGRHSAEAVVHLIEERRIHDYVESANRLKLRVGDDGGLALDAYGDTFHSHLLHPNGFDQILEAVKVPKKYADYLASEAGGSLWGKELLAQNVNEILLHREGQRNLLRVEGDETGPVKGFLSDRFRRLDSRPLLEAFIGACREYGLQPVEGVASDTKCRVRAVLPHVFEPVANEVMIFGAEFGNSDYGDGGLVVNMWMMRVWCTNLAVTQRCLRQVHVGSRLPENVRFSRETYRKDAEATASAVRDITGGVIAPDRVNRMLAAIGQATESEIRGSDGIDKIIGRVVQETELRHIEAAFHSHDEVNMPPGNTVWRLSNAVSWFAQSKGVSADRKLALQEVAGKLAVGDKEFANKAAKEV